MTLAPVTNQYESCESYGDLESEPGTEWYAGGTDLIPLQRSGVTSIERLIDIKHSGLDAAITTGPDGWSIGALATLADLEHHDRLASAAPLVREAMRLTATQQIRNRATVGGNLLQRPRCNYFRDASIDCWMKGGTSCPARDGVNEHHSLIGGDDSMCIATQPSDLASVLVALDAQVDIVLAEDRRHHRRVPVEAFLAPPTAERRSLHTLRSGEVVTGVHVPAPSRNARSTYLKAMDRAVWQFALVGVAAVVDVSATGEVTSARLVASGVSTTPHVMAAAADALVGRPLSDGIAAASAVASNGLTPLSDNGYKIPLLAGLVRRALEQLADD